MKKILFALLLIGTFLSCQKDDPQVPDGPTIDPASGVFVVNDKNIARFRIIKVGQEIQGFIEIISGLKEKDKVIISNLEAITDGTKVIVLGEK